VSSHCRHVDTPWRPYTGRGPTGQSTTSLKATTPSPARLSLHSLLPPSVIAKAKNEATIVTASSDKITRAHHRTTASQKLANSSTLTLSTPSFAPRHQPSNGRVALLISATVVPRRSSSARLLTVARVRWSSSLSASRCARARVVRGCSPWV
jgi:hypothetical protein